MRSLWITLSSRSLFPVKWQMHWETPTSAGTWMSTVSEHLESFQSSFLKLHLSEQHRAMKKQTQTFFIKCHRCQNLYYSRTDLKERKREYQIFVIIFMKNKIILWSVQRQSISPLPVNITDDQSLGTRPNLVWVMLPVRPRALSVVHTLVVVSDVSITERV